MFGWMFVKKTSRLLTLPWANLLGGMRCTQGVVEGRQINKLTVFDTFVMEKPASIDSMTCYFQLTILSQLLFDFPCSC